MDKSRLATLIFDSERRIPESEYLSICEDIASDRFTMNPISLEYKKRESILESYLFVLSDSSRVLVSEDTIQKLNALNINITELVSFMQEDLTKFESVLGVLNGN